MITEEECRRRIDSATKHLHDQIDILIEARDEAEFRAAVAEWAVAGVAALNVRIAVPNAAVMQAGADLGRAVGSNAGAELLHRAGLAFKEHAEHYRLMKESPPHRDYTAPSATLPNRAYWPRPFHRAPQTPGDVQGTGDVQ